MTLNKFLAFSSSLFLVLAVASSLAQADQKRVYLEFEVGPVWFSRNDVRIPNDEQGTRFDLAAVTGTGPDLYGRFYATYALNERHALRLNIAPLRVSGTGAFDDPVLFRGETFDSDQPVHGSYKFNTYRLTYRWMAQRNERWDLGLGAALLVRDAKIQLTQGAIQGSDDDLGLVPLLHLYGAYRFTEDIRVVLDVEGAGASQGRAIDASLKFHYTLQDGWDLSIGYRTLEGGADNDSLYTFAWLHYGALGVGYRFH